MADDSFTRSLYIGRDKAIEVAKRREAVEKELKIRREAKIREQKERISRATQQKEAELKEKSRQRQEKELQKQKKVLDRRCAQLELEKAKKAEILQKAHISASRTNQGQKKPVYAFGSSTPRELSYLEKLSSDQKTCNNNRLSAPSQVAHVSMERLPRSSTPVRTFSRIVPVSLTQKKHPPSTAMTRSVFGTLQNNNKTNHPTKVANAKAPAKLGQHFDNSKRNQDNNAKRQVKAVTPANLMSQSMYEQNKSSFNTKKPAANPVKTTQNIPKSSAAALPPTSSESLKKPVIRPRKAVQAEPISEIKPEVGHKIEGNEQALSLRPSTPPVTKNEETAPPSSQQEQVELIVKREVEEAINGVLSAPSPAANGWSEDSQGEVVDEHEEETLIQLDSPVQPSVLEPPTDDINTVPAVVQLEEGLPFVVQQQVSPSPENSITNREALGIETSKAGNISFNSHPDNSPLSPVAKSSAALELAEQERENRRQRLNQILQRTRMDGSEGAKVSPANSIDASALANDLLAQRRQKQQFQQANSPGKGTDLGAARPATLVDELTGFGFFNKNGEHMPGQIISPATTNHYLTSLKVHKNNNNQEKDSGSDLSSGRSSGLSSPTSQGQPPEDPRTNGHNSSNTPPTESPMIR